MPATSLKQQRFMGMVHAVQKGKMKAPSKAVSDAANSMSQQAAEDFAKTKTTGLPEKKAMSIPINDVSSVVPNKQSKPGPGVIDKNLVSIKDDGSMSDQEKRSYIMFERGFMDKMGGVLGTVASGAGNLYNKAKGGLKQYAGNLTGSAASAAKGRSAEAAKLVADAGNKADRTAARELQREALMDVAKAVKAKHVARLGTAGAVGGSAVLADKLTEDKSAAFKAGFTATLNSHK